MNENALPDVACQELVEIVTDYLENTLPDHDRARFDAHLMTCPGCREYVEQMRITLRMTGRLTVESIAPSVRDELLQAFRRMKASSTGL
jgi:predicted anti-sigma-YlaC factor YlaD